MTSTIQAPKSPVARDPTIPEISKFIATRSGREMLQLVQSVKDPRAQAALTTAILFAPSTVNKPAQKPAQTPEKAEQRAEKAKKALNAFVGFRCYYLNIPELQMHQMKNISHVIGTIWDADPNKSLWSLMAKAWSIIRDQIDKPNAPLDEFFCLVCPHLGLTPPETYLEKFGWDFYIDEEGMPAVTRNPFHIPGTPDAVIADGLSIEDIIAISQSLGYAQKHSIDMTLVSASFLSNPNATRVSSGATRWTSSSVQDRRTADRERRQVRREHARETGFAAAFQKAYMEQAIRDGCQPPEDGSKVYQFGSDPPDDLNVSKTFGNDVADDTFTNAVTDALTDYLAHAENSGVDLAAAFRAGADPNAHLPPYGRDN